MNLFIEMGNAWFEWLLQTSWQAAVLVGLILVVQWLFRKRLSPAWRHGLWLLLMVRLLLPTPPPTGFSVFNLAKLAGPVATGDDTRPALPAAPRPSPIPEDAIAGMEASASPEALGAVREDFDTRLAATDAGVIGQNTILKPQIEWLQVAFVVWVGGAGLLALRLVWSSLRFLIQIHRHRPVADARVLRILEECRGALRLAGRVILVETSKVGSPAVWGLWRKHLLLPMGLRNRFSDEELRHILLHELAHVKRRDLELNWLVSVLQILHWFNPVVWFAFGRMRADGELATDALALSALRPKETLPYGETILKVLEGLARRPALPAMVGIAEDKTQMARRLRAVARYGELKPWKWMALGCVGAIAALALTDAIERAEAKAVKAFTLKGTVVDATGHAVAGAIIETYMYDTGIRLDAGDLNLSERAAADANGTFEVRLPRAGALILARKAGLAPTWRTWRHLKADLEERFVLTPPAILGGTVVDQADQPVVGAEVFVQMAFGEMQQLLQQEGGGQTFNCIAGKPARELFRTRTGVDGRFRIEGFPTNASANLWVRAPGKAYREWPPFPVPESTQCRAGDGDIRLVVEPAGSIEGRIVAKGATQPLPTAALTLKADELGFYGNSGLEPVESGDDGSFRIPDVGAGNYRLCAVFGTNLLPDWVAEAVPVVVQAGQVTQNVEISATRGGLLQVTVLGRTDRKPRPQVSVCAGGENYRSAAITDNSGAALLRLPPGIYQVYAYWESIWPEHSAATVETGKTNRLEIEMPDPVKITGVVRGPDGQPAAGSEVLILGSLGGDSVKTDAKGKFEMVRSSGIYDHGPYCLIVRDPEHNLAAVVDIDEDTGPLDILLAPAMTIVGRAECDGKPVTNATAALLLRTGRIASTFEGLPSLWVGTNRPGHFEIPALPPGERYRLKVSAPGYGGKLVNIAESDEAKRVEIEPVQLRPANLKLAGQVLDAEDKPVSGAHVSLSGKDQPYSRTRTDREGHFRLDRVCEGSVQLSAEARRSHGAVAAEGGDTNVVIQLGVVDLTLSWRQNGRP